MVTVPAVVVFEVPAVSRSRHEQARGRSFKSSELVLLCEELCLTDAEVMDEQTDLASRLVIYNPGVIKHSDSSYEYVLIMMCHRPR